MAQKTAESAVPKTDEDKLDYLDKLLERLKQWESEGKIPTEVKEEKTADAVENTVQETTAPAPVKKSQSQLSRRRRVRGNTL